MADEAFDALRYRPYSVGEHRDFCPSGECRERRNKRDRSLAVSAYPEHIVYHCWHCDAQGAVRRHDAPDSARHLPVVRERPVVKAQRKAPPKATDYEPLTERGRAYLRARLPVDEVVADAIIDWTGLVSGDVRGQEAIGYPYFENDRMTGIKFRAMSRDDKGKRATRIEGSINTLFLQNKVGKFGELLQLISDRNSESTVWEEDLSLEGNYGGKHRIGTMQEGLAGARLESDSGILNTATDSSKEECLNTPPIENLILAKNLYCSSDLYDSSALPPGYAHLTSQFSSGALIICEGEDDALSCLAAGAPNATSVPHGAINAGAEPQGDNAKLSFVTEQPEFWKPWKQIILATDGDGNGRAMMAEVARRVGRWRSYIVNYPDGYKDANAVLAGEPRKDLDALGAETLNALLVGAEPASIPGLYQVSAFKSDLRRLRRGEIGQGVSTGFKSLDVHFRQAPANLVAQTGMPKSGKSELIDAIQVNIAERMEREGKPYSATYWSPENGIPLHIAKLCEKRARSRFFQHMDNPMSDDALDEAESFVQRHFHFLSSGDGGNTIKSILERSSAAVARFGCKALIIDPYNYVARGGDREDQAISDMLSECRQWAQDHEATVYFVAHPKGVDKSKKGKVVDGYDISGGPTWWAKCDFGLTVHREDPSDKVTQVHVWACRHAHLGSPGMTELLYDTKTACFSDRDTFTDYGSDDNGFDLDGDEPDGKDYPANVVRGNWWDKD